eukprot:3691304-Prymnesium_polylepis.1
MPPKATLPSVITAYEGHATLAKDRTCGASDDSVDEEKEGDVARGLGQPGDVHSRQCAWRHERSALRETKADGADQARKHRDIAKDGREGKVAEGTQQREAQDAGKEEHHDLVLRAVKQLSQHAYDEVDIGNANADAGEGDAADGDRVQDRSLPARERDEQQLR